MYGDDYSLSATSENLYLNSVLDRKVKICYFISLLKLRLFCSYRTYCCEASCFPPLRGKSKLTKRDRCRGDRYAVTWRKERPPMLRSPPPPPRHVKAASQTRWGPAPLGRRKMTEGGGAGVYLFSADLASWHKSSRYRQPHRNPGSGST